MTAPGQVVRSSSGQWVGLGRSPIVPSSLWVPGLYEPHLAKLGTAYADVGARVPRSACTVVSTDPFVPANGAVYNRIDFRGKVLPPAITTGALFYDCYFTGSNPTTSEGGQFDARAGAGVSGARWDFLHCTFRPDNPNAWTDNVIGHHCRLTSCLNRDGTDLIGSYNTNGSDAQNEIYGCYGDRMTWFYPDPTGVHADGTHNDWLQHQGGVSLWVVGNSVHGYTKDRTGNIKSLPNPNGSSPNYNQSGQGILVQQNVGASSDVHINKNWLYGAGSALKLSSAGGLGNVEMLGNRFMDMGAKDYGGTYHYYWIRFDAACSVNGATYSSNNAFQASPSADDNRWGVAGTNLYSTVAIGDLVPYRVDP